MSLEEPLISVVLGSFNQKEVLEKVLNSFESQSISPSQFEVIVIDSSSTDGTGDFFKTYQPQYAFRGIVQPNQGKTSARNRGVKESRGKWILITDADMIAHPDLVKNHLEAQQKSLKPTSFEGLTYNMTRLVWPPELESLYPYIQRDYKENQALGWYYFLTGNISFPRDTFYELGGFNETFKGYGWEDLEMGYRFKKAKIPHLYLKSAINYHYHVVSDEGEIERNVHKGKSAKVFLTLHPELKWFLGCNPLSVWLYKHISKDSSLYKMMMKWQGRSLGKRHQFGTWFLKEWHYLSGILG